MTELDGPQRAALDPSQRAVLEAPAAEPLVVVGAPGTGKTTALVEVLAHRVAGGAYSADEILALAPARAQAARLRDRIAARLGGTVSGTRARTPQSLAFEIVREQRAAAGKQPPVLLTGADDDALIRELVEGSVDPVNRYGFASPVTSDVLRLAGFRTELRDLKSAMSEYDVSPDELASYGVHRPVWRGAANLIEELETVLSLQRDGAYDVPGLLLEAASILHAEQGIGRLAVDRLRLVVVDDAQELTEAARRLLVALEARGVTVITFGDPDIATGTFRGGGPEHAVGWRPREEPAPRRLLLTTVHRHREPIRSAIAAVTARIGARGEGRHRAALASTTVSPPPDHEKGAGALAASGAGDWQVRVAIADSAVAEARLIAATLRRLHLEHGVAWSDMAVLARSGAALPTLARLLARAEVPTSAVRAPDAGADPAVAAIVSLAGAAADPASLTGEVIEGFLSSPLFGVDAMRVRQLRRALRKREVESGGGRSADELLVEAIVAPAGTVGIEAPTDAGPDTTGLSLPARHPAIVALRRLAALLRRAGQVARDGAADEVLWAVWEGAGVADRWRRLALRGGGDGEGADARLDAVVTLFDVAKRVVERTPDTTIENFVMSWEQRDVESDSLASRAEREAVTLATPASVVGREFRAVVVSGVNEGTWPNLRLRDTLLGAGHLIDLVTSRADDASVVDRRREVLDDESRMFAQALSRAREWLLVTAVESDDGGPSILFRRLDAPHLPGSRYGGVRQDILPSTLRELTADLRRRARDRAVRGDDADLEAAALARLARAGVHGAHPDSWLGLREPSTTRPLVDLVASGGEPDAISVSPSAIERFEECGVEWFVTSHGGGDTSPEMTLGTLVHAAAEFDFRSRAARLDYVSSRFDELRAEAPWREAAMHGRLALMLDALEGYVEERRARGVVTLATERPFVVDVPVRRAGIDVIVRMRGTIDRIEGHPEEGVRIVDLKTSKTVVTKAAAEAHAQLAAYQLAARRRAIGQPRASADGDDPAPRIDGGEPIDVAPEQLGGAALVFLGRGKHTDVRVQPAMTSSQELGFERRLVRAALGMAGLVLVPDSDHDNDNDNDRDNGMRGAVGSPAAEASALVPVDPGAPAAFTAAPESHCESSFGGVSVCRIHIVPEVTE
ncbi:PD-(D/E)XK nuclease family protein [Pseudoclavibacter endophyticus]|nr:PD-(D/E)XK nuclease family protein [Pseudoclavibacter endophyticus]